MFSVALYHFVAESAEETSLYLGEPVFICLPTQGRSPLDSVDDCVVVQADGERGLFPKTYLRPAPATSHVECPGHPSSAQPVAPNQAAELEEEEVKMAVGLGEEPKAGCRTEEKGGVSAP